MSGKNRLLVGMLVVALFMMGNGFLIGYYHGTGEMPAFGMEPVSHLPPDYDPDVELREVSMVIADDKTNEREYKPGYNCLDFAWDTMRSLSWQGIPCYITALQFEDGTSHAILAVPTSDLGLIWFDPQADRYMEPDVGQVYNGKRVIGMKIMNIEWLTLEEFSALLQEGDFDGS